MQGFSTENGILTIDLGAMAANYRLFQQKVGIHCGVAGVIKANAYGLGLEAVAKHLKSLNCPQFFVATLDEALQIRELDTETPVAVLGGLFTGTEDTYTLHNITPVLNSPDDIKRWIKRGQDINKKLPAYLHFDTGMNRLGLSALETKAFLEDKRSLDGIDLQLIMSHFVSADDWAENWAKDLTLNQAQKFDDIAKALAKRFPKVKKSLANSPGLFRSDNFHYDMVRPGFSLYGGNPTPETQNPVHPVISLNTRILQTRTCKKGESIGYGASHKFDQDTKTATVALGYADGFLRSNSSKATLYYNGQPCPVLGRVSMDLVTIDISMIKDKPPQQGDAVEILGPNQSIDDLAATAGTIGYEILTSLGSRYKREYIGG